MSAQSPSANKRSVNRSSPGVTELSFLLLAFSGWCVLMANMFGFAGRSGWIFPAVTNIMDLAISTLLLAIIGLFPMGLRLIWNSPKKENRP